MTIEEKGKAYDKVREKIALRFGNNVAEEIFSQFEESGDERIRKEIIAYFKADWAEKEGITRPDWIDWLEKQADKDKLIKELGEYKVKYTQEVLSQQLEKQGETFTKKDVDDAYLKGISDTKNEFEKQGKQQSIGKVKPKFKVGDWIVCCDYEPVQIIGIRTNTYEMSNGDIRPFYMVDNNHNIRLWTIQDAKDADILVDKYNNIGILKMCEGIYWHSYIYLGCDGELRGIAGMYYPRNIAGMHEQTDTYPATKEQRDLLFQKMKEAGYEWDAEKKELKRIKQEPTESPKDYHSIDPHFGISVEDLMTKKNTDDNKVEPKFKVKYAGNEYNVLEVKDIAGITFYVIEDEPNHIDYVKAENCEIISGYAIKKNGSPYPTNPAEWSEEDENLINSIIKDFDKIAKGDLAKDCPQRTKNYIPWLKTIKERVQPQPKQGWSERDEEMIKYFNEVLDYAFKNWSKFGGKATSALEWLELLKDRYTWKPSKEQIKGIECAIKTLHHQLNVGDNRLDSLYDDLKKLREE